MHRLRSRRPGARLFAVVATQLLALALFALAGSIASSAHAQGAAAAPTNEARATAREAYGRAQQLFQAGDYAGSEAAFMEAYAAMPNPIVLMGVGESRERAGNLAGAIEAFERYLAERTDAPDAAVVRTRIEGLRAHPATLAVRSAPSGAGITLDGEATGRTTPAELEVAAGEHSITLSLEGHAGASRSLDADPGAHEQIMVELTPVAAEPALGDGEPIPETVPEDHASQDEAEDVNTGVWVTAGISAGALLMGTVIGFLALSEESGFNDAPTADSADRGEKLALFADVAFGIAAAAALTGVILHFTQGSDDDDDETATRVDVAPAVGPHGAGLTAQVRF